MAIKISGSTIIDDSRVIVNADKIGIGTPSPTRELSIFSSNPNPTGIGVSAANAQSTDVNKAISVFNAGISSTFAVSYTGVVTASEYFGTFKGTIDSDVAITNANKIKINHNSTNDFFSVPFFSAGLANNSYQDIQYDNAGSLQYNPNLGNLRITSGAGNTGIILKTTNNLLNRAISFQNAANSYVGAIGFVDRGSNQADLFFITGGTNADINNISETMRLTKESTVGIGTTRPDGKLHVFDGKFIVTGGVVGIGTTIPSTDLHISGEGAGQNQIRIDTSGSAITINNHSESMGFIGNDSGKLFINAGGTEDTLSLRTNGVERLRITGFGLVGIGTDDPLQKLNVYNGTSSDTGGILVQNVGYADGVDKPYLIIGTKDWSGATTNWNTYGFQHRIKSTSPDGVPRVTIDSSGGTQREKFCVDNGGNVGIGTIDATGTDALTNNTSTLAVGIVTANELHGTIKGTIDPGIAVQKADSVKITEDEGQSGTNYIFFGDNSTEGAYDGVRIDKNALVYKNGLFGIGTNDPQEKLHVVTTSASAIPILVERTHNNNAVIEYKNSISSMYAGLAGEALGFAIDNDANLGSGPMFFVERTTGKVGIGLTNPSAPLVVRSSDNTLGILTSTDDGANIDLFDDDTQSRIRTVDGRLQFEADKQDAVDNSEIRFLVDGARQVSISSEGHIYFGSDIDNYFHRPAANNLAFVTNDVERLRITQTGNIGIGTIDPTGTDALTNNNSTLAVGILTATTIFGNVIGGISDTGDVNIDGNLSVTGNTTLGNGDEDLTTINGNLTIQDANPILTFIDSTNDSDFRIEVQSGQFRIQDDTNGDVNRLHINSSGNIGIGTSGFNGTGNVGIGTFPHSEIRLKVVRDGLDKIIQRWGGYQGSTAGHRFIDLHSPENDNQNDYFKFKTGNAIKFQIDSTDALCINSSGKVGIGTDNPLEKLDIISATNTQTLRIWSKGTFNNSTLSLRTGDSGGAFIHFGDNSDNDIGQIHYNNIHEFMRFIVNTQERLRITGIGSVGIGTDDPQKLLELQHVANRKLQFSYDDNLITIKGSNNNANPETIRLIGGDSIRFNTGTTGSGEEKVRITSDGDVGIGTINPTGTDALTNNNTTLAVGIVTANEVYGTFKGTIDSSVSEIADLVKIESDDSGGSAKRMVFTSASSGNVRMQVDTVDGVTYTPSSGTVTAQEFSGGGSGITGLSVGSDKQVIFNSVGTLAGSDNLAFDSSNKRLGIGYNNPAATLSVHSATINVESEAIRLGRIASNNPDLRFHSIITNHSGTDSKLNYIQFNVHNDSTTTSQTEVLNLLGNGRVGIGSTIPQAKLDVKGDINFNNNMLISNEEIGNSDNIDHIWHNDAAFKGFNGSNSISNIANGTWNFVSDGSAKVTGNSAIQAGYIISSNGGSFMGDVGIGTTNPHGTNALTNNNATLAVGIVTANQIFGPVTGSINTDGNVDIGGDLDVDGSTTLDGLTVSEAAVFNNSLTVGASASDQGNLAVHGTGKNSLIIRTTNNNSDRGIAWRNSGAAYVAYINAESRGGDNVDLVFGVDRTNESSVDAVSERMRITREGNVGIGTTHPTASNIDTALQSNTSTLAVGTVRANQYFGTFKGTIDSGVTIATDKIQENNTKAEVVDNGSDGHFLIETDGTERFRVISGGNVGISSNEPKSKLDVRGDIKFNNNALIASFDSNGVAGGNIDHIWHNDSTNYGRGGTWNFVSDGAYKGAGQSTIQIGYLANAGGGHFLNNVGIGTTTPTGDDALTNNNSILAVGIVTANDGFFTNVKVSGTLTYEDVTNIDSVGIITAQNGIHVTANGIDAVGVITATSFEGNLNASDLSTGTVNTQRLPTTYSVTNSHLKLKTVSSSGSHDIILDSADSIIFNGDNGASSYRFSKAGQTSIEGFLSFENLTTDRTFTFPNETGTIALLSTIPPAGGLTLANSVADIFSLSSSELRADDAGADKIVFYDNGESKLTYLSVGTGLEINGTELKATSAAGKTYTLEAVDSGANAILRLSDGSTNDDVTITAGSNITINPVAAGGFTIAAVAGAGLGVAASAADVLGVSNGEITADDAGSDKIVFYDESAEKLKHLSLGTGLQITGTTLETTSAAGGASVSSSPPSSPQDGALWWDSDDGDLHVYYDDGSGSPSAQWVSIGGQGAKGDKGESANFDLENKLAAYTIASTDKGKLITNDNNFTIDTSTGFSAGDAVSIHNKSGSTIGISTGTGVMLRFGGSTLTGNRSLTPRGLATIVCLAANVYIIAGAGVT